MAQYTVLDALILCGLPHPTPLFLGLPPAQRVATDIFHDDFATCRDKEQDKSGASFSGKTYDRQWDSVPAWLMA